MPGRRDPREGGRLRGGDKGVVFADSRGADSRGADMRGSDIITIDEAL
jgi:hypothetical protein